MRVRLIGRLFSPGEELDAFTAKCEGVGAVVSFTGVMRSMPENPISELFIEHYAELAVPSIEAALDEATERFRIANAQVIHRHGLILAAEPIMQVMTSAPHRADAFTAAEFLMDWLKTDAPFWKKETNSKAATWVLPRAEDDLARRRWEE